MGFLSKLKLRDWRGVGNAPTRKAVLYTVDDVTGEATPVTVGQLGGGGGSTDPASAREATLELVRQLLAGTLAVNAAALPLPTGAATDAKSEAIRALLAGTLNVNTGLNGLATQATLEALRVLVAGTLAVTASSLPLPTGAATEAKSEAIRLLLAGTLKTAEQIPAPGTLVGDIPANSSVGTEMSAAGLSGVRLLIGPNWTAADLSFETSADDVTWLPLYDPYGGLIVYKVAASRAVNVPVGDLLRLNRVRARSGVPGAYVNQVAAAGVTLVTAGL